MLNLLEYLTTEISGSKTRVESQESEGVILYTIFVPQEKMGLLIGKSGKTIRAIRSLARARAVVDQTRITVQLQEE